MSDDWTPTGRWRHVSRRAWKAEILVLQIEERGTETYYSGSVDCEWRNRWRDATTADLTVNVDPAKLTEETV